MALPDQLPPVRFMPRATLHAARRQLEGIVSGRARAWQWRLSRGATAGLGIGLAIAGGAAVAATTLPTKGPVPFAQNGSIDWRKVPDFLSVSAGGKVVGYAPRADVLPHDVSNRPESSLTMVVPVYGSNLRSLVGHLYPGIGFVLLGVAPSSESCVPAWFSENGVTHSLPCPSQSIRLPDIVGMRTPSAAAMLSGLGVSVDVVNVASTSVAHGLIVSMFPAAGSVVSARSIVMIRNSSAT
jgi:hypothetical protein